jgi:glycosyltransferase involved in cell wall biosynthesis
MKRLNILFISTENPFPLDHGHHIRTYNVLKLIAGHHDVHFLGFVKNEKDFVHLEPVRRLCRTAHVFLLRDGASRFRMYASLMRNLMSPLPYIAQKYYQNDMDRKIKEVLGAGDIDIVHFDMLHLGQYMSGVDVPKMLTEHNVESLRVYRLLKNSRNVLFKGFMYFQYLKLKRYERDICTKADVCAVVSENDMNELKAIGAQARFVVIPNGVDTDYFAPEGRSDHLSLIWTGGMNSLYNREAVDFFADSIFPRIEEKIPDVKFSIVGAGQTKKILKLRDKNQNVRLTGYVDDVRPYMDAATVYIAPIKSGSGTKLKVLHALSMGKPVITTTVGAEGLDVQDGVHLLIEDDPKMFAEKTVYLLTNPAVAERLGKNGRRLMVEKYDWRIIGRKISEVYGAFADRAPSESAMISRRYCA